jgi:hypothetical protein
MSFLRHEESFDPMTLVPLGVSGLAHSQCSSASMSSSRLFLGRLLSSRACLRFADRERFSKTKPRRTMIFQRTATPPLTSCLSPRVHSISLPPFLFPPVSATMLSFARNYRDRHGRLLSSGEWERPQGQRRARNSAALGYPRHPPTHRNQVWLRRRTVRRLHGARRRSSHAFLLHAGFASRGQKYYDD